MNQMNQENLEALKQIIFRNNPFHCATCQTCSDYEDSDVDYFARQILKAIEVCNGEVRINERN